MKADDFDPCHKQHVLSVIFSKKCVLALWVGCLCCFSAHSSCSNVVDIYLSLYGPVIMLRAPHVFPLTSYKQLFDLSITSILQSRNLNDREGDNLPKVTER